MTPGSLHVKKHTTFLSSNHLLLPSEGLSTAPGLIARGRRHGARNDANQWVLFYKIPSGIPWIKKGYILSE